MSTKKKQHWKLKKWFKRFFVYLLAFIIIGIYSYKEGIKVHDILQYHKSYEYKIIKIGYPSLEAKKLASTLSDNDLQEILDKEEYDDTYYQIVKQKYFLVKNYHKYLDYYNTHQKLSFDKVIALVNVHANEGWYSILYDSDVTDGYLILVNKFYHLKDDYQRDDLINFSLSYSYGKYGDNKAAVIVVNEFEKLQSDVKDKFNVQIMINSSYRSYKDQSDTFKVYGDRTAARPGHSEHQTGLAFDITSVAHPGGKAFGESEEGKWIKDNCWQYGFIIRYPEGKEDITGYDNEPWHFRYVGKDVAKKIYEENITFDEYYAYYIEK